MIKPQVLDKGGMFIDYQCTGIIPLERGIWFPWYYYVGGECREYIDDVNNFIKKWYGVDYELGKKFRNEIEETNCKVKSQ